MVEPPIVDLRHRLSWSARIPARIGTGAMWMGSLTLLAPLKLAGLMLASSLVAPALLWQDRRHRDATATAPITAAWTTFTPDGQPDRATVAQDLGLSELQVFRARHASICTVHHDDAGCIVELVVPAPSIPAPLTSPDAHPVG